MAALGRLNGKIGLITGAARGIGAGIAQAMAEQGASLYLCDLNIDGAAAVAKNIGATAVALNVTSEADWAALADRIKREHGRLDILVHNAGTEIVNSVEQQSSEDVRRVLSVNLEGPMSGCRIMLPLLSAAGKRGAWASVINISSVAALVGQSNLSAYSVSKAAIAHMSKVLAVEWANQGHPIRVNTIFPGCIKTPMLDETVAGWVREGVFDAASAWDVMKNLCPMKRIGEVSDIAMGAVFLASDESKFMTGTSLTIDGGWMAS